MSEKFSGGCDHINTHSSSDPIDNHTCHCSVCKRVTGQPTTHVAFFNHGDLEVDNPQKMNKQPFNTHNRTTRYPFDISPLLYRGVRQYNNLGRCRSSRKR